MAAVTLVIRRFKYSTIKCSDITRYYALVTVGTVTLKTHAISAKVARKLRHELGIKIETEKKGTRT